MVLILIAMCLLAVGKIHSQNTVVSFIVETRTLALPDYRPPQEQNQDNHPPPPRLFQNPNVPQGEHQSVARYSFDLPLQPTLRVNQPTPHLFISRVVPEKMERPDTKNTKNEDDRAQYYCSDVLGKVDLEKPAPRDDQPASASHDVMPNLSEIEATTKKTINATITIPTVNVTLDERANFDGDQCPAGYIRVNGKCVEKD